MKIFSITEEAYDIADDVMMGDPTPIKYCKICKYFSRIELYDELSWKTHAVQNTGVCVLDNCIRNIADAGCQKFCHRENA